MCLAFFWHGHVSGTEDGAVGPHREGRAGTETPQTIDAADPDGPPPEWIAEILENRELFESLDLLERLDLYRVDDRFSSHRFE
jgi:hypothetical protein